MQNLNILEKNEPSKPEIFFQGFANLIKQM